MVNDAEGLYDQVVFFVLRRPRRHSRGKEKLALQVAGSYAFEGKLTLPV